MERDITGRAVQQSARIVQRVMDRIQQKVPLGPSQLKMSREELRTEMSRMRGEPMMRLAEMLGDDEVMNILRGR